MSTNAVILLTGPSAAGKSTVARLLAEQFAAGVHVAGDFFRHSIVSGRHEMTPDATPQALEQLRLRYRLAAAAADAYFEAGFTVVLDNVAAGPLLSEYVELIQSRPRHVVVLLPSPEALAARESARDSVGYHSFSIEQLYDVFVEETPRGLWLDSSDQTPEETVAEVLARIRIA